MSKKKKQKLKILKKIYKVMQKKTGLFSVATNTLRRMVEKETS